MIAHVILYLLFFVFVITVILIRAYKMRAVGLKGTVMENVLLAFAYARATLSAQPGGISEPPLVIMDRGSAVILAIAFVLITVAGLAWYGLYRRSKD
jgi:hypothetical protein